MFLLPGIWGYLCCSGQKYYFYFFHKNFLTFLFIFGRERKRQGVSGGEAEREGDPEAEAGSRLWAVSTEPNAGLKPTNSEIMTWAKVGRLTD